eukprot:229331-Rhodomonas_salina.3
MALCNGCGARLPNEDSKVCPSCSQQSPNAKAESSLPPAVHRFEPNAQRRAELLRVNSGSLMTRRDQEKVAASRVRPANLGGGGKLGGSPMRAESDEVVRQQRLQTLNQKEREKVRQREERARAQKEEEERAINARKMQQRAKAEENERRERMA